MIVLSPEIAKEAREIVLDDLGVLLTDDGLALLLEHPEISGEIDAGAIHDTCVREEVYDLLAKAGGATWWPYGMDCMSEADYVAFVEVVQANLIDSGLARPLSLDEALAQAGVPGRG